MPAMRTADISVYGLGFYQITARSSKGRRFMLRVDGSERGTAYCDDSTLTLNIVDAALGRGLTVDINGKICRDN